MNLARGRVLRARADGVLVPVSVADVASRGGRRLDASAVAAAARARAVIADADAKATGIVEEAERRAIDVRLRAEEAGRADGLASLAAWAVKLSERDARADIRSLDRIVELAGLVAERALGGALGASPERVVALARQVLDEARGARTVTVHAHPDDAPLLEAARRELDDEGRVQVVVSDPALRRGDLRIETELGVIDARLGTRVERLVERLRQVLQS